MFIFLSNEQMAIIEARYCYQYCLAYIALVGYGYTLNNNLNDDKLFKFEVTEYDCFSFFLSKYQILGQVKNFYEKCSIALRNNNDKYFDLIAAFDEDYLYILDLVFEKEERLESLKEHNLDSAKENSGKKEHSKNEIKEKEKAKDKNENGG